MGLQTPSIHRLLERITHCGVNVYTKLQSSHTTGVVPFVAADFGGWVDKGYYPLVGEPPSLWRTLSAGPSGHVLLVVCGLICSRPPSKASSSPKMRMMGRLCTVSASASMTLMLHSACM